MTNRDDLGVHSAFGKWINGLALLWKELNQRITKGCKVGNHCQLWCEQYHQDLIRIRLFLRCTYLELEPAFLITGFWKFDYDILCRFLSVFSACVLLGLLDLWVYNFHDIYVLLFLIFWTSLVRPFDIFWCQFFFLISF